MAGSDRNGHRAGQTKANAARIVSAVSMLGASLGMNTAAAMAAPENPTVEGSTQAKIDSAQKKHESTQVKVESRQVKVGSEQVKVGSEQVKVGSEQVKVEKPD